MKLTPIKPEEFKDFLQDQEVYSEEDELVLWQSYDTKTSLHTCLFDDYDWILKQPKREILYLKEIYKPLPMCIHLQGKMYALELPYHVVSRLTVGMASVPQELRLKGIRFAAEEMNTAGTLRANSESMQKHYPAEVAMLKQISPDLKDYIIVQIG